MKESYLTTAILVGKPKAYPKICSILDEMVQQEKIVLVERSE